MTEPINANIPKTLVDKVFAQDPNKSKNFSADVPEKTNQDPIQNSSQQSVETKVTDKYRNPDGSFISIGSIGPGTILFGLTIWYFFFRK